MHKIVQYILGFGVIILLLLTGCDLDISNPNSPTEDDALSNPAAMRAFVVGMQGYFTSTVYDDIVLNTGVTTREMAVNTTFTSLIELEDGGIALPTENSRISSIWQGLNRTLNMADLILNNAPDVIVAAGDRSGIVALAATYKALALGYLVQSFEQAPLTAGNNASFSSRSEVLGRALQLLDEANEQLAATAPSNNFASTILLSGFDLQNTIYALQARYNLFNGNYQAAIDAANRVDVNATSVFSYDGSTNRNPIFDAVAAGDEGQEYAPQDNFGSELIDPADLRLNFYLTPADTISTPNGFAIDDLAGFFTTPSSSIPVYLPDEMALIRAEAYIRQGPGQYGLAVNELNAVRTQQPAEDAFGVGGGLPPYTGPVTEQALLQEIFTQRSAELYLTGMRFEDMRRLNRPVPSDNPPLSAPRNRVYYPYPNQERQNNPNTPPDPEI